MTREQDAPYTIGERVADELVRFASERADNAHRTARSTPLRGAANAKARRDLRRLATDYEHVVAGVNAGNGVTRGSAA